MLIKNLDSKSLIRVLKDNEFICKIGFYKYEIIELITNLDENSKKELFQDSSYIKETLGLNDDDISKILCSMEDNSFKINVINSY